MKTAKILTILSLLFLTFSLYAGTNPYKDDKSDVEQTISNYVKSIDSRNADALSKSVLNDGSIITLNNITNKVDQLSGRQLVDMVKNGQKGGWVRNVSVNSVDVDGNTAMAKVDISDSRLKESGFLSLIKENGNWKIAGQVTTLGLSK